MPAGRWVLGAVWVLTELDGECTPWGSLPSAAGAGHAACQQSSAGSSLASRPPLDSGPAAGCAASKLCSVSLAKSSGCRQHLGRPQPLSEQLQLGSSHKHWPMLPVAGELATVVVPQALQCQLRRRHNRLRTTLFMKLCSASRLCSMNSWVIWNFCTAFFSGTGGTMMPAGIAAAWHMAPRARLQAEAAAKGY